VLAFAVLALVVPVADEKPALPVAWHGTWRGTLVIDGPKKQEVPVTLKIEPLKDGSFAWVATYAGPKEVVKDYKLVPDPKQPNRFQVDENNGIILDSRLVGNVLYSVFAVEGPAGQAPVLLTARYELRGDVLHLEVTSAVPAAEKTGKGQVQSYPVTAVQTAELRKK
jgi:hypothetical protein